MSAAVVALALAISGCDDSTTKPQQSPSPSQPVSTSSEPASTSSEPNTPTQAAGTITLEVTGTGDVYAIWSEPFGQLVTDHATLPFSKSFSLPAETKYVSLNWTTRDDNPKGCKITVDNKVVVEQAPGGGDGQCVFNR
jgi:hypothetical protein